MDQSYDFIVFGTGITECVLSWAHASKGKKVLQIDKNATYGSELRTLAYSELASKFGEEVQDKELEELDRHFCIDLVPKLMLADGKVREFLHKLNIFEVVDFVTIPGSFIYKNRKIHTIPSNEKEAIKSGVIGIFQKPRVVKFFWDVNRYCKMDEDERRKASFPRTMREYFEKYGLDKNAQEFIGHAIALNLDDSYLDRDPRETLDNIHLFVRSLLVFDRNIESPYIYPLYGSSEISQAFSRKAAINGAVFRLNTPVLDIKREKDDFLVVIDDIHENKNSTIRSKNLIGDPTYFIDKVRKVNDVVHCICIIKGDTKLLEKTSSAQVIFLASELKRKNDIFLLILGERECSVPKGFKVAMISTVLEGSDPEKEVEPVVSKLENIVRKFTSVRCVYEPGSCLENIFISRTVDQSTHFESLYADIIRLAKETGVEDLFEKV